MKHFDTIDYLRIGTPRQQKAYYLLKSYNILSVLDDFTPIVIGTIPLTIDTENSDIDIACYFTDESLFVKALQNFHEYSGFRISFKQMNCVDAILCDFVIDENLFEIFAQPIPVKLQYGYRHMIAEYNILRQQGEEFRKNIIALKKLGVKTEPAFAKLLGLSGSPYEALLNYSI